MDFTAVTVGVPVRDLDVATAWYRAALNLGAPGLEPLEGLVEFDLGPVWLQLAHDPDHAGNAGVSVDLGVSDAAAAHARFAALGLDVSDIQRFEGVVKFFELTDPDGSKLGFVTELS